jgi:hypothetical protein
MNILRLASEATNLETARQAQRYSKRSPHPIISFLRHCVSRRYCNVSSSLCILACSSKCRTSLGTSHGTRCTNCIKLSRRHSKLSSLEKPRCSSLARATLANPLSSRCALTSVVARLSFDQASRAQQMRLIHGLPFTPAEVEWYRQLVFQNLTYGMKCVLDVLGEHLDLRVSSEHWDEADLVYDASTLILRDDEPYPPAYKAALSVLWQDPAVCQTVERGNEFALPEKCASFYAHVRPHTTIFTRDGAVSHTFSPRSRESSHPGTCPAPKISCTHTRAPAGSPRMCCSWMGASSSLSTSAAKKASAGSGDTALRT